MEELMRHTKTCEECKHSLFGYCPIALAIIGKVSGLRDEDKQRTFADYLSDAKKQTKT